MFVLRFSVFVLTTYEFKELNVFVLIVMLLRLSIDALVTSREVILIVSVVRFRMFALRELIVLVLKRMVLRFTM